MSIQLSDNQLLESFIDTLHHLSIHTRSAYVRDLKHLQKFCIKEHIMKWSDLKSQQLRNFIQCYSNSGL